jgi:hypothetical protein
MCVCVWGCGGGGGGGGGGSISTPTHPTRDRPRWGKRPPHPLASTTPQAPRKGVRALYALPVGDVPYVDHTQICRELGGGGSGEVSGRSRVSHLACTWRRPFNDHDHSGSTLDSQLPLYQPLFQSKYPRANRSCRGCEFKLPSSRSFSTCI